MADKIFEDETVWRWWKEEEGLPPDPEQLAAQHLLYKHGKNARLVGYRLGKKETCDGGKRGLMTIAPLSIKYRLIP